MRIAQITDPHVSTDPVVYDGAEALRSVLADIGALDPAPDLIVLTGDLAADGQRAEYDLARGVLSACRIPMIAVPGNHDARAAFAFALRGSDVRIGDDPFLNVCLDLGGLRILAFDTLDEGQSGGLLCDARIAWAEERLDEAVGRSVLIFMHHPPFLIGQPVADGSNCRGGERLATLVARHGGVLTVSSGHVHRAVHRAWAGTIGNVCPSVAWEVAIDQPADGPVRLVPQRPAYQLHDWRPDTGLVTRTRFLPEM